MDELKKLLVNQNKFLEDLLKKQAEPQAVAPGPQNVPLPPPLCLEGDMDENYTFFEGNWKNYASAVGMSSWPDTENPKKVSFLMSVVGPEALKKFCNFELTEADRATPDTVLAAIKRKVTRTRNVIVDRLDFFTATQSPVESIDDYRSRLKSLARPARFGNLEAEMVTYKLATSNKWPHLRSKMLTMADLTEAKAIDLCRVEEITAKHVQVLSSDKLTEVNKVKASSSKARLCKFCGDWHVFTKGSCPAYGKKCKRCSGKNHFEKVCRKNSSKSSRNRLRRVKKINDDSSEDSDSDDEWSDQSGTETEIEGEIGKIFDNSKKGGNVLAEVSLKVNGEWKRVKCELDTGANTSLIGHDWLCKLTGDTNPELQPSPYKLQAFGGAVINVLGQVKLPCKCQGKTYMLVLQVVDVSHRPLLSLKVCTTFGLIKFCNSVRMVPAKPTPEGVQDVLRIYRIEAEKIVEEFGDVFRGYGKFDGEVTLEIDEAVPPVIQQPRRVPIAMRPKLKAELDQLEKDGIIAREYNHTEWVEFVTGKENVVADAISRAPHNDSTEFDEFQKLNIYKIFKQLEDCDVSSYLSISDSCLDKIMKATEQDAALQTVIDYIRNGWPNSIDRVPSAAKIYFKYRSELSTQDGLVFRNDRILIPSTLQRAMIDKVHLSHNGIESTLKLARENIFWPGMSAQITDVVKECQVCAKFAASQQKPPMQSHAIPIYPWQVVSMDVFFTSYHGKKRQFLVTVDHYSDYIELDILKDMSARSLVETCRKNFARHGIPQIVNTDNGTNFVNEEMKDMAIKWNFKHSTSSPHHQQANGKAEAAVKIAKRLIQKADETGQDVWYVLLHWRNIPNKIGSSPVTRLFSRSTRCGVPAAFEKYTPRVVQNVPEAILENKKKVKYYYDRKSRALPALEIGSPVFVQAHPEINKNWTAAVVSEKLNDRSYVVDANGANYRRDLINIRPRKEPTASPLEPTAHLQPGETLPTGVNLAAELQPESSPLAAMGFNEVSPSTTNQAAVTTAVARAERGRKSLAAAINPSDERTTDLVNRPKRERKIPSKFDDFVLDN